MTTHTWDGRLRPPAQVPQHSGRGSPQRLVSPERGVATIPPNKGVLTAGSDPLPPPTPFPNNTQKTISIQNLFNNKVGSGVSSCSHGWPVGLWRARTSGPWSVHRVCRERREGEKRPTLQTSEGRPCHLSGWELRIELLALTEKHRDTRRGLHSTQAASVDTKSAAGKAWQRRKQNWQEWLLKRLHWALGPSTWAPQLWTECRPHHKDGDRRWEACICDAGCAGSSTPEEQNFRQS